MELKEIIASVRGLLQDEQYPAGLITEAANWFVYSLANNNRLRMFEASDSITASEDDTTADFPGDMLTWTGVWATAPASANIRDTFMDYGPFMESHFDFAVRTPARASEWTMYGNAMRFAAPLSEEHTFQIDYIREPEEMEADADECEIPRRYFELVSKGTKARIMEIDEDYEYGQQERDLLEPLVNAFIRNESRGGGKTKPTVIRTRRRGANTGGIQRLGG